MNYRDTLLTNENLIKSTTNIFDGINGNYLLPSIKIAQDLDLESVIGTELLRELQRQVYNNNFKNIYKDLLDNYILSYLNYATIVRLIPTLAYKISNAGILRTDDEKMTSLSPNDIDKVRSEYVRVADVYKNRLQRFLIENHTKFPELDANSTIDKIRQNLYSSATCGIVLGGARGKK